MNELFIKVYLDEDVNVLIAELVRLQKAGGKTHHGIIIAVRRPIHKVAERLLEILNDFTADEMKNQVIYI